MKAGDKVLFQGILVEIVEIEGDGRIEALSPDGRFHVYTYAETLTPVEDKAPEVVEETPVPTPDEGAGSGE